MENLDVNVPMSMAVAYMVIGGLMIVAGQAFGYAIVTALGAATFGFGMACYVPHGENSVSLNIGWSIAAAITSGIGIWQAVAFGAGGNMTAAKATAFSSLVSLGAALGVYAQIMPADQFKAIMGA